MTSDPQPEDSLAESYFRLGKRLRHRSATELAPLGLTPSQARALRTIARGGPLRIVRLAAWLDIVPRSATAVVDALEQQGLVTRTPDPGDRRSVLVSLSAAGEDRIQRVHDTKRQAADDLFDSLPAADRATLTRILATLHNALDTTPTP